ncbi:hypothetical protein Btru_041266 [Bulinus truncatus]|nr:hypothetical protein Btru_041266 [Bulinus truncatus]
MPLTLSCEICDVDIPSRPAPKNYYRRKRSVTQNCTAGHYSSGGQCLSCEDGTFMTQSMAESGKYPKCEQCNTADETLHEIVLHPCTKTRDTSIGCSDNFFKKTKIAPESCGNCRFDCTPCSACGFGSNLYKSYTVQNCSGSKDAVCCSKLYEILLNDQCADGREISTTGLTDAQTTDRMKYVDPTSTAFVATTAKGRTNDRGQRNISNHVGGGKMFQSFCITLLILFAIFCWRR